MASACVKKKRVNNTNATRLGGAGGKAYLHWEVRFMKADRQQPRVAAAKSHSQVFSACSPNEVAHHTARAAPKQRMSNGHDIWTDMQSPRHALEALQHGVLAETTAQRLSCPRSKLALVEHQAAQVVVPNQSGCNALHALRTQCVAGQVQASQAEAGGGAGSGPMVVQACTARRQPQRLGRLELSSTAIVL